MAEDSRPDPVQSAGDDQTVHALQSTPPEEEDVTAHMITSVSAHDCVVRPT